MIEIGTTGWYTPASMPKDGNAFLVQVLSQVDMCWYDIGSGCFRDYYYKQRISYVVGWRPLPVTAPVTDSSVIEI